ncbi:MAG: hypothetical protein LUQ09_07705 [Methanomassiliicoccales archaeon]|nr:hypothetical protein [Methanomassiliicoccales archaeon]
MQQTNNSTTSHLKTRAIIIRCSDPAFIDLLNVIRSAPETFLVFSKTSQMKLVVEEVPF